MMGAHKNLIAALQGSNARKRLKRIHDKRYLQVGLPVYLSMCTQVPWRNPSHAKEEKSWRIYGLF